MRFAFMLFFASPAADPPSLILSPAEAARQRSERRVSVRQARTLSSELLRRLQQPNVR